MLRSLMSGVAGLKAYQTKMDVIGNNIANVNTVGFKSSSVNFSDIFYQTTQSASASTQTKAGTNAKQIGYGSAVASIATTVANQGGSQTTNRALDLMINGNAFFIVQRDGQNYFTKNGAFDIDGLGNLSSESGGLVMGWGVDKQTGEIVQDAVSPIRVYSAENQTAEPDATTDVYFQGNIDYKDTALEEGKIIQMDFFDNLGNQYAAKFKVKSEHAEDNNEYRVELIDVIDANENSIFVDAQTSAGVTTYKPKDNVTIDFGGYTYRLDSVDKVTGEVKLISYEVGADGVEAATLGDVTIAAKINYEPQLVTDPGDPSKKVWQNALYRLNGNQFEVIPKNEIHLYADVDELGNLTMNTSIDEARECAYYLDGDNMIPITANKKGGKVAADATYDIDKFLANSDNPCYYDKDTKTFTTISDADIEALKDPATGKYDKTEVLNYIATKDLYYKDSAGNFKKIAKDTTVTWGGSFDEVPTYKDADGKDVKYIEGAPERTEQQQVNKGAEILFNASTGKFASVSGQSSRYDENNNLITNNVTFKVYTSDSRLETSAINLFEEITIDFSSLTMYADGGTSTVSGVRGNIETGLGAGWASGVLTGVSVSNDGKIYGEYDNGVKQLLGQIAVTSFANPTGLEAVGNSLFKTTVNSGEFDGVGSDIYTLGLSITSGALESSNVDLSTEFTNMITTQRGFEANSKIITTSDSMLDTLINLKR